MGRASISPVSQNHRMDDMLTSGQVAKIMQVAPRTVSCWIDSGKLKGIRLPPGKNQKRLAADDAGDRRVMVSDLLDFANDRGFYQVRIRMGIGQKLYLIGGVPTPDETVLARYGISAVVCGSHLTLGMHMAEGKVRAVIARVWPYPLEDFLAAARYHKLPHIVLVPDDYDRSGPNFLKDFEAAKPAVYEAAIRKLLNLPATDDIVTEHLP